MIEEVAYAAVLLTWVLLLVKVITRKIYEYYVRKGADKDSVIYYNRKIIHLLAGGVATVLTPFLFTEPFIVFGFAMILAFLSCLPYFKGKINYWYQVPENMFDVHFCLIWGFVMLFSKLFANNWWLGVIPLLFMSVGDAVTGIVRNVFLKKRTKSWWGNLAMLITCAPIGALLGFKGVVSAIVASLIERYEYKWIDDNITVPLISFFILSML
ncbi:dolichol kinase [Candidatus Bathyarchaeota archaeon]|nr:MAG: dolichol kinase [Candidatus Bathyarchaeota archaeon]